MPAATANGPKIRQGENKPPKIQSTENDCGSARGRQESAMRARRCDSGGSRRMRRADRGEIAEDHDLADPRNRQREAADEQAPQTPPERAAFAPEGDPTSGIIETDDLLFGMVSLTDDAEVLDR